MVAPGGALFAASAMLSPDGTMRDGTAVGSGVAVDVGVGLGVDVGLTVPGATVFTVGLAVGVVPGCVGGGGVGVPTTTGTVLRPPPFPLPP